MHGAKTVDPRASAFSIGPTPLGNRGSAVGTEMANPPAGGVQQWKGERITFRRRRPGSREPAQIPVPRADLVLHEGEVRVHLAPQGGLGQAAVGVDRVNLGHFQGDQPTAKTGRVEYQPLLTGKGPYAVGGGRPEGRVWGYDISFQSSLYISAEA